MTFHDAFPYLVLCLGGCSSMKPVHVDLTYFPVESVEERPSADQRTPSRIAVLPILDERTNKESLGFTDAPITGSDVTAWVDEAIGSLAANGYEFVREEPASPAGRAVEVRVKRASCRGTVMHLRCTVLLDVAFYEAGSLVFQ